MLRVNALLAAVLFAAGAGASLAQSVGITDTLTEARFAMNGREFVITRNQDTSATLTGEFAQTSRQCPPFCVQPMRIARGVSTIGELELLEFLQTQVSAGTGLLIDARVPEFYSQGWIPGAVNVPFTTLHADNPYRDDILKALGAVDIGGTLDFTNALSLTVYCNGPWCQQAPIAIQTLLDAGYPPELINYYRGGMQDWLILGFNTENNG